METLYIKGPFIIGDVTLFAIEQAWLQSAQDRSGLWLNGAKQIYAIIICDTNGKRAIDIDATDLDLASVIRKVPGLDELLKQG